MVEEICLLSRMQKDARENLLAPSWPHWILFSFLLISFSAALSLRGQQGFQEVRLNHDSPPTEEGGLFDIHVLWPFSPTGLTDSHSQQGSGLSGCYLPLFCKQGKHEQTACPDLNQASSSGPRPCSACDPITPSFLTHSGQPWRKPG